VLLYDAEKQEKLSAALGIGISSVIWLLILRKKPYMDLMMNRVL
jgi:hypothetical protein